MVIVSGMTTSRMIFSRGPWSSMRARSRSRRRRIEASERSRSVSSRALTRVSLPRRRSSTRLTGFGSAGRAGLDAAAQRRRDALPRRLGLLQQFDAARAGTGLSPAVGACGLAASSPKRRRAASSARSRDDLLGLAAGLFLGLAALGLLALAGEALVLGGAAGGGVLGGAALLGLVDLGVGERAGAGVDLVGGELAQHEAGARGAAGELRRFRPGAVPAPTARRSDRRAAAGAASGASGLLAGQDDTALLALDLNRVGAAVREALANGVAFDIAALQAQGVFLGATLIVLSPVFLVIASFDS